MLPACLASWVTHWHAGHTSGLYGFPICGVDDDIKGATRALPPGHPLLPEIYQGVGQPVLIPEDMGIYSYVLAGAEGARTQSFGSSSCHGANRLLSRTQATKMAKGRSIRNELEAKRDLCSIQR